jgi:hypothetical protein
MTAATLDPPTVAAGRMPEFRYVIVLLIVLALVIFEIVAPDADWARAILVALAGAALIVAVATSRAPASTRARRVRVVGAISVVVVLGIATGIVPAGVTFAVAGVLIATIPVALAGGLRRLIRERGVRIHAVAGGLAIYLLGGLLFASVIAFVARVQNGAYFAQGPDVSNGDCVYYSFSVLTTTGFGDYTAAQPVGHALAVLEMLTGQLYLVTVLGVLIGHFGAVRRSEDRDRVQG